MARKRTSTNSATRQAPGPRLLVRRRSVLTAAGALLGAPALAQSEERYPSRPIRFLVPSPPGGLTDTIIRAAAEQMRDALGQAVVVDNRPGANGTIAAEILARAPADGHTIGVVFQSAIVLAPHLMPNLPYRVSDLMLLTMAYRGAMAPAVGLSVPARDAWDFVELARRQGSITCGTHGRATPAHLLMEMLAMETGVTLENVVCRGEPLAVLDMLAGTIPAVVGGPVSVIEQHRKGDARIIGIPTEERIAAMPEVPTFVEAGYPSLVFTWFHGIALPGATPPHIAERLHSVVTAALTRDAVRARMSPDMTPALTSPGRFREFVEQESARLGQLIRGRNIRSS